MPELTADQARALSQAFLAAANAVSDFRCDQSATLSGEEKMALDSLAHKLSNVASDFTATAIGLSLDDLEQHLNAIRQVTADARAAMAAAAEIGRVVAIAASLVALGTAVAEANPNGVLSALESTKQSIAG